MLGESSLTFKSHWHGCVWQITQPHCCQLITLSHTTTTNHHSLPSVPPSPSFSLLLSSLNTCDHHHLAPPTANESLCSQNDDTWHISLFPSKFFSSSFFLIQLYWYMTLLQFLGKKLAQWCWRQALWPKQWYAMCIIVSGPVSSFFNFPPCPSC